MAFPVLEILDSFKRAPENPLDNGGDWAAAPAMLSSFSAGKIEGEKYVGEAGTVAASYWTPQEFTEAAVAVNVYGVEGTLKGVLLLYNCVASPATVETGYYLGLVPSGVGTVKCEIGLAGVGKLAEANIAGMKEGDGIALDVKAGVVSA